MKSDLRDRLAALRIEVDEATTERHLAAVETALQQAPAPTARVRGAWRRRLAPVAAGLTLFATPVAAVAAESSVPGDLLYPVKQVTEEVRSWFDPDIVVEHRLDELETVLERDAAQDEVADRLDAAEGAVSDAIDSDRADTYRERLEVARDRAEAASDVDPIRDRDRQTDTAPTDSTPEAETDGNRQDRQPPKDADVTTTTTEPSRDGDGDGEPGREGRDSDPGTGDGSRGGDDDRSRDS